MTPERAPLHALAMEALDLVQPQPDGRASCIPPGAYKKLRRRLFAHQDDRQLFVHLCVLHARLARGGLSQAASQFLELARIGLGTAEVRATIEHGEALREAATSLTGPVSRATTQEALRRSQTLGVGLRQQNRGSIAPPKGIAPKK